MGKGCELLKRKNVVAAAKASKELMLELDPEGDDFEQVRASTRPRPETRNPKFIIRSPRPKTHDPKPLTRTPKPET